MAMRKREKARLQDEWRSPALTEAAGSWEGRVTNEILILAGVESDVPPDHGHLHG